MRTCSSKVQACTSEACALTATAEMPSTEQTSRRCRRVDSSSMLKSSLKASRVAGITPVGSKSLKRGIVSLLVGRPSRCRS